MTAHRVAALGLAIALLIGGGVAWRQSILQRHQSRTAAQAKNLLETGRAAEALGLLHRETDTPSNEAMELRALVSLGDTAHLAALWRLQPATFAHDEHAAVLAARGLLQACDPAAANQLIEEWRPKAQHPSWWLSVRADGLLAQRKRTEAQTLLERTVLRGAEDAPRLLRLALLCDIKSAAGRERAWRYLERASALAPQDSDVLAFRAELLEAAGRTTQAEAGYCRAWLEAPQNPARCEQVAAFYRRRQNLPRLQQALELGMTLCPTDTLRVQALFWQRMASARPLPSADPPGGAQALGRYLSALPPAQFHAPAAFDTLSAATTFQKRYPEVAYLQLTQALSEGKLGAAAELLTQAQQRFHWNPTLERGLAQLLRQRGQKVALPPTPVGARHPFLLGLETPSASPAQKAFLASPHAVAAVYLTAGWWEAALRLAPLDQDLSSLPIWYSYGLTQALRASRGERAALDFLAHQQHPPRELALLHAELLRATGAPEAARQQLVALTQGSDAVAWRATSLASLIALETQEPNAIPKLLQQQPALAQSETGQALRRAAAQLEKAPAR